MSAFQKASEIFTQRTRPVISDILTQFQKKCSLGLSEVMAANELEVPRTSIRHWKQRANNIPLPKPVVNFFESKEGAVFLHQLVTASQFVMTQVGSCGIRLVNLFLKLSGLHHFVANSYESLRQRTVEMEKAIVNFGEEEKKRLGEKMPHQFISIAEDETFHPKPCLVAIEPVSNFILLEKYSDKRDSISWNKMMDEALDNLKVTVRQSTSDEAKGIINHVESHLGAHHSSDIFHVEQEISKATSAALAAQLRQAEKEHRVVKKIPWKAGKRRRKRKSLSKEDVLSYRKNRLKHLLEKSDLLPKKFLLASVVKRR